MALEIVIMYGGSRPIVPAQRVLNDVSFLKGTEEHTRMANMYAVDSKDMEEMIDNQREEIYFAFSLNGNRPETQEEWWEAYSRALDDAEEAFLGKTD